MSYSLAVSVRRGSVTQSQCPMLKSRIDALLRTSIAFPDQNVIRLHPFQHRVVIDLHAVHMDATLGNSESAIVRWASATSKALRQCVAG